MTERVGWHYEAHYEQAEASPWVARFAPLIPEAARCLISRAGSGIGMSACWRRAVIVEADRDSAALATLSGVAGVRCASPIWEHGAWPYSGRRRLALSPTTCTGRCCC